MLPKIWKKVLLAICILACLFNVTSKLVNKTSLETNLDSIKGGISFSDLLKSFDEKKNANTINNGTANIVTGTVVEDSVITTNSDNIISNESDGEYIIIN